MSSTKHDDAWFEAKIAEAQAKAKAAESKPVAVQLPLWPELVRAVPNGFLRSSLFGATRRGRRSYLRSEVLASLEGIDVAYTGERLDQSDLDVYESVLHTARLQDLGTQCRVTSYALLRLMGLTDSGKNRKLLHQRIVRLRAGTIEMQQGRYKYIGGLIDEAYKDEETQEWLIVLNPRLKALFAPDQFTQIQWSARLALGGKPLAQWLHGFYSSHAKPFPIKVETLRRMSGSKTAETWKFAQNLRRALDAVAEVYKAHGQPFSYQICEGLVHVDMQPSKSQRRHLARKGKSK